MEDGLGRKVGVPDERREVLILVIMEVDLERLNICLSKEFEDRINPYCGGIMIDSPDESLKI